MTDRPALQALAGRLVSDTTTTWIADEIRAALAADLTAYRAGYDTFTLGLYTSRDEARAHCLGEAADSGLELNTPHWMPDHGGEDAPEDLGHVDADGDSVCTGYTVTPLTVHAEYDPDAEG